MRSISIDSINFEFGSWEVGPEQAVMIEPVAAVMRDMTNQNPGEVFLIEGHTDAVGSDIDNLSFPTGALKLCCGAFRAVRHPA